MTNKEREAVRTLVRQAERDMAALRIELGKRQKLIFILRDNCEHQWSSPGEQGLDFGKQSCITCGEVETN